MNTDDGAVVYYGDHKAGEEKALGATRGNRVLEEVWSLHRAAERTSRLAAPPLILFVAEPWKDIQGKTRQKGVVRFIGIGVMRSLEPIQQVEPMTGRTFPNYRTLISIVDHNSADTTAFSWSWINSRRRDDNLESTLELAPPAWQAWVTQGSAALPPRPE